MLYALLMYHEDDGTIDAVVPDNVHVHVQACASLVEEMVRRGVLLKHASAILLMANGDSPDRIVGLRRGEDDRVANSFSPGELIARVATVLRRIDPPPDPVPEPLSFEGLQIDPAARRVTVRGKDVQLTVRECALLLFLAGHPGKVFSRSELMDAVWQYTFHPDTSTVTVYVRRLRAKIERDPATPCWVQTVRGVGYRFEPRGRIG